MTPPSLGDSATCSSLTQTTFWLVTHTHTHLEDSRVWYDHFEPVIPTHEASEHLRRERVVQRVEPAEITAEITRIPHHRARVIPVGDALFSFETRGGQRSEPSAPRRHQRRERSDDHLPYKEGG